MIAHKAGMCLNDYSVALLGGRFWRHRLSDQTFDAAPTDDTVEAFLVLLPT